MGREGKRDGFGRDLDEGRAAKERIGVSDGWSEGWGRGVGTGRLRLRLS